MGAGMLAVLAAGCGGRAEAPATQVAARVNKAEITVHQVNFVLQQQRGLRPEQVEAAGRQVLERLIDQQLVLAKADELKLDRDPQVLQRLEAARREILARATLDRLGDGAAKPGAEEIHRFYDTRPALFKDRRLYNIQEIAIEAGPEQVEGLRRQLAEARHVGEFVEHLKSAGLRFAGNQAVRAAEQLPPKSLELLAGLPDGQGVVQAVDGRVLVIVRAASRSQPLSEEQARPAIEQILLAERRHRRAEDELRTLRAAARIEYLGAYAAAAPSAAPSAASSSASAAAGGAPADPARVASAALSAAEISKGMGLR